MASDDNLVKKKHADTITKVVSAEESTPLRRSLCREGSVDEDYVERASRLVAKRNLEDMEGKLYENSVLNFSCRKITDNIKNVGISFGSDIEHVQMSVKLIKNIEMDRFKLPSVKTSEDDEIAEVEDSDCDIDHLVLDRLYSDLTEELMDDDSTDQVFTSVLHNKKNQKGNRVHASHRRQVARKLSF